MKRYDYVLPTWTLPYIINGDSSELYITEKEMLDEFLSRVGPGIWSVEDGEYFAYCNDVNPLAGTVVNATLVKL